MKLSQIIALFLFSGVILIGCTRLSPADMPHPSAPPWLGEDASPALPTPGVSLAPTVAGAQMPDALPTITPTAGETHEPELPSTDVAVPQQEAESHTRQVLPARVESEAMQGWRLFLPQIGVNAPVVSVGLEQDGAMGTPTGPDDVGWYRYGPLPGQRGNVLLDGHVDWTDAAGKPRTAVFWDLARLIVGSEIIISRGGQDHVYAVTEKRSYGWDDPDGASVLQPTSDARVTLITCGGIFDRLTHNYSQREVVIAQLVSPIQ